MSKRQHPEHGEYIALTWDCSGPDFYAVRGHVTFSAADQALRREVEAIGEVAPDHVTSRMVHTYAGWRFDGSRSLEEGRRVLMLCAGPARGAFPVTVYEPAVEPRP